MEKVISGCDCVVLPSYREGMPRSILEAFAVGRPAIVSDVPGCRDAIEEGVTGLLVPVKDANALAKAIKSLLDDPVRCAEMGKAGRKHAEEIFDVNLVVEKHMKIYQELLSCC